MRFMRTLKVREDRPQRGYNSYVPVEPLHQLQADLADMSVFSNAPYRYMLLAVDTFTRKVAAVPMSSKTAPAAAEAWQQIVQALGIPSYVYTDDGSEFKAEFKQKLDYFDIEKIVSRGHAYFAERAIRTVKEALTRRISSGLVARNRWYQLLPDVLAQYNSRNHAGTGRNGVEMGPKWGRNVVEMGPKWGRNGVEMGSNGVEMGSKWGRNGVEMGSKWARNGVEMGSKWGRNGVKMGSKWGQNGGMVLRFIL